LLSAFLFSRPSPFYLFLAFTLGKQPTHPARILVRTCIPGWDTAFLPVVWIFLFFIIVILF
jgi:hypothetical protein